MKESNIMKHICSKREVGKLGKRRLFVAAFFVVALGAQAGLVNHWRFDNDGVDTAGANNAIANPSFTSSGRFQEGASFGSGVASMGNIRNYSSSSTFSISVWIKTTDSSNDDRVIVGRHKVLVAKGYFLSVNTTANQVSAPGKVAFFANDSASNGVDVAVPVSTKTVTDGNWHHIVGVYNGPGDTIELWVDGAFQSESDYANLQQQNDAELLVGGVTPSSGSPNRESRFSGTIDEVRIYSHALSASEISDIYNLEQREYNLSPGSTLIANQLNVLGGNNLSRLFLYEDGTRKVPLNTEILIHNGSGFTTYTLGSGGWSPSDPSLNPGGGAFIDLPSADDFFIEGLRLTGMNSVTIPTGDSIVSFKSPKSGKISTDLGFPTGGSAVGVQSFQWINGTGYDDPNELFAAPTGWHPEEPNIAKGEAVFIRNPGTNSFSWSQNLGF